MFLKRFFLFMALVIGACGGAWGAVDPRPSGVCVAGTLGTDNVPSGETEGIYNTSTGQGINAHYIVYFDNASSAVPGECNDNVSAMANSIKSIEAQLNGILLFATADKTGTTENNVTLAQGRLTAVKNALSTARVTSALYDCTSDSDGPCASFAAGDQPWEEGSQFQGRAVYIFLIYNENPVGQSVNICNNTVRDALTGLLSKLAGYKAEVSAAETKLQDLIEFCEGGKPNAGQNDVNDFENKLKALLGALPSDLGELEYFKSELEGLNLQLKVARVQAIYAGLSTGGSVWKNTDGKFNSYRLMADSTGAVVLGTAGALLSSHLIKKAQVKEGFEDLQCTIGGQLVANWGDEFLPRVTFVQ